MESYNVLTLASIAGISACIQITASTCWTNSYILRSHVCFCWTTEHICRTTAFLPDICVNSLDRLPSFYRTVCRSFAGPFVVHAPDRSPSILWAICRPSVRKLPDLSLISACRAISCRTTRSSLDVQGPLISPTPVFMFTNWSGSYLFRRIKKIPKFCLGCKAFMSNQLIHIGFSTSMPEKRICWNKAYHFFIVIVLFIVYKNINIKTIVFGGRYV